VLNFLDYVQSVVKIKRQIVCKKTKNEEDKTLVENNCSQSAT